MKNGIVVDLEATCEDRQKAPDFRNEIIEIGAVKIKDGQIVDTFESFVKPKFSKLTPYCTQLTTITAEHLQQAPAFPDALAHFIEFCDGMPLLSWGFYDRKQFEKDCHAHKLNTDFLTGHRSLKHEHAANWHLKRALGVSNALKMANLTFEGVAHRGIDDAKNIAKIYLTDKYL